MDWKKKFLELTPKPVASTRNKAKMNPFSKSDGFDRQPIQQPVISSDLTTDTIVTGTTTTAARAYYKENRKLHSVFKAKDTAKREGRMRKCRELAEYELG